MRSGLISGLSRRRMAACLALATLTLAAYCRAPGLGFVFDDLQYITGNEHVKQGLSAEGLRWAFTSFAVSNWHPLTWISHQLDATLFGLNPGPHHLVNLVLHLLNTLLFFGVLRRMTGAFGRSLAAAALFAAHPLHVESVAWVAERKDLLSGFFFFLCLHWYGRWLERPGPVRYLAVVAFMSLGLLSKPMLVTLPLVLLLLDWWPLGRFGTGKGFQDGRVMIRALIEKLPLLALSIASGLVTYRAQAEEGAVSAVTYAFALRAANAAASLAAYAVKTVWPANLAAFYPFPTNGIPGYKLIGSALLLLALTALVVWSARRRGYAAAGLLWFAGMLFPVSGLPVQAGSQAMADRYMYLPLAGILTALVWAAHDLGKSRAWRGKIFPASMASAAVLLALLTFYQTSFWVDDISLFSRAVSVTRNNWFAHYNLGAALQKSGRFAEAELHYRKGLAIRPGDPFLNNNLSNILHLQGRLPEAMSHLQKVLAYRPDYSVAWNNLGNVLDDLGLPHQALEKYERALALSPGYADAWFNRGLTLDRMGQKDEARRSYAKALSLQPDLDAARERLEEYQGVSSGK